MIFFKILTSFFIWKYFQEYFHIQNTFPYYANFRIFLTEMRKSFEKFDHKMRTAFREI
jgi:hypothetical protein